MWLAFVRGGWGRVVRWAGLWRARDGRLLLVAWVVLPMIVFCLSRSKLHLYILPLAAPLALIVGRVLANRASWRALRNVTIGSLIVFVAIKGVLGQLPSRRDMASLGAAVRNERAALPAGAPIVLWDEAVNHGVTFYLGLGREQLPERIAEGEKGKFEHWTPEEFLARYEHGAYPHGALVIADRRKAGSERFATMRTALVLTESPASTKHWSLLRLPPAWKPAVPQKAPGPVGR
jgi:4-amino-4-deoxy-L-arabinose transferase